MPDSAQDRTEAPTPRRREEARRHGQIAKSGDLTAAVLLLGGLITLRWFGPGLIESLVEFMRNGLEVGTPADAGRPDLMPLIAAVGFTVLKAAGPILVALIVLALAINWMQVGFLLTSHPLMPSLNRLNPLRGFTRLFNTRTWVQLAMNLLKLGVVCLVSWRIVSDRTDEILLALDVSPAQQAALIGRVIFDIGTRLALLLMVLALLDYAWQRFRHEKDLRMSKQEIKEEMRRMEGDPVIKQRRRQMQYARTLQLIRKAVPKADVVVTNPTEFAVAIQYDSDTMHAPRVVAKGADHLARKIREIAALHGVPIVERKPLARALYQMVEVGHEVPEQFYQTIAEILAYVYQLAGKRGRRGNAA